METVQRWLSKKPETTLYHYTSLDGFMGIVQSKAIRATKIQYLSDASEFAYAFGLLVDEVRALRGRVSGDKAKEFLDAVSEDPNLKHGTPLNTFVSSFSKNGNLLSQWRAYCPPEGGVSVGFHPEDLEVSSGDQWFFLAPCVYEPAEQRKMLTGLLMQNLGYLDSEDSPSTERIAGECGDFVFNHFLVLGPCLKDPAFREEQEWRLVSRMIDITYPRVRYRQGRSMLVPYFEVRLTKGDEPLKLADVYVGPTPHIDLSIKSIDSFLSANGVKAEGLKDCKIPYRTW